MPYGTDFRLKSLFSVAAVGSSGRSIGRRVYWKLYAVENIYRIVIHSILSAQIGFNWWDLAVDQNIQAKVRGFRRRHSTRPWHSTPGTHDIYYTDLFELNEIARANAHLFVYLMPDIDQWLAKIESVRIPRNVVAHMNFPNSIDTKRIDVVCEDFKNLISSSSFATGISLQIPS